MKTNMNRNMKEFLERMGIDLERDREKLIGGLPANLRGRSSEGFLLDCLVGEDEMELADKTAAEAGWSKLHISDYVDDARTPFETKLTLAIRLGLSRVKTLQQIEPNGLFRVIVSGNSEQSWPHPTAVCRFHRLWPGEEPWLWEDLERYSNPVLTIDTEPQQRASNAVVEPGEREEESHD